MISGGLIGGGAGLAAPTTAVPPEPAQGVRLTSPGSGPAALIPIAVETNPVDLPANGASLQGILDANSTANWINAGSAGLGQLGTLFQGLFNYWSQENYMNMTSHISDNQASTQQHISDNQKMLGDEYFAFVEKQDGNLNGVDGIKERLANIQANTAINIRQRELDTKERLAALHNVDTVFGFDSRQNYSYGFAQA